MKNNILVTSISSKVILLELIRTAINKYDKNILLYGADINSKAIATYFVDKFLEIPRLKYLKITTLIDICNKEKIKYIIPTRDDDVKYFSFYKKKLLKNGIFVFSPEYKSVKFCFDKLMFYKKSKLEQVIKTSKYINHIKQKKLVVKERFGSGSSSIVININKKNAKKHAKELNNPIFQPFIKGDEYSIDSYLDENNTCIACIIRSRDLIIDGEAKITTIKKDKKLKGIIVEFLQKHKIIGHSVTQVIKSKNNYHIIECNTRFGGASSLSYKMGLESFYWFLLETNNKIIKTKLSNKKLRQVRVSKDIYFES